MKALADHHDQDGAQADHTPITGWYSVRVWELDCILEVWLDETGHLAGSFSADGEPLEITCETPNPNGGFFGVIRANTMNEPFAVFRARLHEDDLVLEVNLTDAETGLETTEHVTFARLDEANPNSLEVSSQAS